MNKSSLFHGTAVRRR